MLFQYSWRYKGLGNLTHVDSLPAFQVSNAGFCHQYQFINVEDFEVSQVNETYKLGFV